MNYILSSVDSISLMIMETWAAASVGDYTKQVGWGGSHHKCPQEPSAGQSRVPWTQDQVQAAGAGSGCWHAGVHIHLCSSNIAHTTLCCQETWGKTEGSEETPWWAHKYGEGEKAEGLARAPRKQRRSYCVAIEMGNIEESFRSSSEPGSHREAAWGEAWLPLSCTRSLHCAHSPWMCCTAWQLSLAGSLCWGAVALFLQVFQECACPSWISSLAPGSVCLGEAEGLM